MSQIQTQLSELLTLHQRLAILFQGGDQAVVNESTVISAGVHIQSSSPLQQSPHGMKGMDQMCHFPSFAVLTCKWLRWSRPIVRLGVAWVKQRGFVFFSQGALVCVQSPVLCQLQAADWVLRKCSSPLNVHVEGGRTVLEDGYKHKY